MKITIPDNIAEELEQFVDGVHYKSPSQLASIIIADWLDGELGEPDDEDDEDEDDDDD